MAELNVDDDSSSFHQQTLALMDDALLNSAAMILVSGAWSHHPILQMKGLLHMLRKTDNMLTKRQVEYARRAPGQFKRSPKPQALKSLIKAYEAVVEAKLVCCVFESLVVLLTMNLLSNDSTPE